MAVKTGDWDGEAISIRNIRWLRHRFQTEISPHFAISYNYGINVDAGDGGRPRFFANAAAKAGRSCTKRSAFPRAGKRIARPR